MVAWRRHAGPERCPGWVNYSFAYGINNGGQVVGTTTQYEGGTPHAVLWTNVGAIQSLGDLPGGLELSVALAINDSGHVAGDSSVATGIRAFIWTAAGGMQDLGVLPGGAGNGSSYASGINSVDQVVGNSSPNERQPLHAVLWTNGAIQDLQRGPVQTDSSYANGINDAGEVVGGMNRGARIGDRAFLWSTSGGMRDLNDLIDPRDPLKAVTTLGVAEDINNAGQIVGFGVINGKNHGFMLSPVTVLVPEPASSALVVTGLGLTGLMLRWRAR